MPLTLNYNGLQLNNVWKSYNKSHFTNFASEASLIFYSLYFRAKIITFGFDGKIQFLEMRHFSNTVLCARFSLQFSHLLKTNKKIWVRSMTEFLFQRHRKKQVRETSKKSQKEKIFFILSTSTKVDHSLIWFWNLPDMCFPDFTNNLSGFLQCFEHFRSLFSSLPNMFWFWE